MAKIPTVGKIGETYARSFKLGGLPNVTKEARAVFPELPPDARSFKLGGLPNVTKEARAVFLELPSDARAINALSTTKKSTPDAVVFPSRFKPCDLQELSPAGWRQNPIVGARLDVKA